MEFKELKKKSIGELHKSLLEKRNELREARFKDANKQLKDVRQIRAMKKLIARILTLINASRTETAPKAEAEPVEASIVNKE
jgi:large subunit ribosomal protein L29